MSKVKKSPRTIAKPSRKYLSQVDVPAFSLEQALRVPTAIDEHHAGSPVTPLRLAQAMMVQPTSGPFRSLCGASIAYGLTQGGYNAQTIVLEPLGKRITRPLEDGDELAARREAVLRPRVIREFLQKYNGSGLPRNDIATSVLADMGVPRDRAETVFDLILENAEYVGFLRTIKGKRYVDLAGTDVSSPNDVDDPADTDLEDVVEIRQVKNPTANGNGAVAIEPKRQGHSAAAGISRRVYITHGKNRAFIEPIKKLLKFGELEAVVSVDTQSVSKPVPQKVMDEMRSCGAAIIHVEPELAADSASQDATMINSNVLIEIGAAMALFGNRFILLVRDGIQLPSNLQGLFVEKYQGSMLDADVTIRLIEAINTLKKTPLPDRYHEVEHGA